MDAGRSRCRIASGAGIAPPASGGEEAGRDGHGYIAARWRAVGTLTASRPGGLLWILPSGVEYIDDVYAVDSDPVDNDVVGVDHDLAGSWDAAGSM